MKHIVLGVLTPEFAERHLIASGSETGRPGNKEGVGKINAYSALGVIVYYIGIRIFFIDLLPSQKSVFYAWSNIYR